MPEALRPKHTPWKILILGLVSAAFFDLDKTVIAKSSTLAFGRPFYKGGLVNRRAVLKSSFAQFLYLLQGADEETMDKLRDYLAAMCAGWPVQQVQDIVAETLHELIEPLVYSEALELFAEHRAAGREIVIVSSSGDEVVGPIGDMLGVDRVIATRMVVEDGLYTGAVDFYAYGENKATAIADLAAAEGWDLADCFAYSDSFTDAPMLAAVGHPYAVNPDKALRKEAADRDWPVLVFAKPVRAQRRVPTPAGDAPAWAALVVVGVALGVAWFALRRARSVTA